VRSLEIGSCPVCKTNNFRELASSDEIRRQVEELWAYHTRRLKPGAPVQQLFDRAVFSQAPPVHIVQCEECGTVMRNPRESETSIVDLYANEDPPESALEDLFDEQVAFYAPRVRTLEELLGRSGNVLEVGSYLGAFLHAAQERGWKATGVDVNESANAFARARGADVMSGTLDDVPEDHRYDVVALWNCLDQLPDPERALLHARALMSDGGIVSARVPNGAFYATLLKSRFRRTLLAQNNLLAFPYRHGFTPSSLRTLLSGTGFEVVRMRGDTLVATAGSWTRRWAAAEERIVKAATRRLLPTAHSPWIEVYARAV
jgi:2-polyprenyl-3-methyl-5-hydroxy-6-metoxy-1,4-benzoquinol methylase